MGLTLEGLKQETQKSTKITVIQELYFLNLINKVTQKTMNIGNRRDLMKEDLQLKALSDLQTI